MTTNVAGPSHTMPPESAELAANLARIEELTQRLVAALAHRRAPNPALEGPGVELMSRVMGAWWGEALTDPARLIERQAAFWGQAVQQYAEAQQMLAQGKFEAPEDKTPKDRRFANPLWQTHPYFHFVKQQYQQNVAAMKDAIASLDLTDHDRRRVDYFARQIMDMMAPTNFLPTNPDALEKALETGGESLVQGLENLVRDVEANHGDLLVTLADREAFSVGGNIATTPGKVVFRNRMIELIQYAPSTDKVRALPVVLFPPWINKFYILDLKPQNSLIKWVVDQGFTLFVVSWKNPDASYAGVGMDDYVQEGFLAAMEAAKAITGQEKINAIGYCIAGTTLALTLALMRDRGDKSVNSATFFTTLTDFSEPGEVGVYLDNDFVDGIEAEVVRSGYLDKYFMSRTFSYLRANDLIYTPAIKSYMLGEAPPAFDLLFWNGDGTNLPARMAVEYLRGLCQEDGLAKGTFEVLGQKVSLKDVKVPLCAIACETDHIAPWVSSFAGIRSMGSKDKTFILAQSGHIAGIVSPPGRDKYGHYLREDGVNVAEDAAGWKEGATFHKGSWWPAWGTWLAERSGKWVPSREPGDAEHPPLAPAPGTYVTEVPRA